MRNNVMEPSAQKRSVGNKVESKSQNQLLPSSTAALSSRSPLKIKSEFGERLASFKPPRDLTLATVPCDFPSLKSLNTVNKKVFVPNVNVTRRKNQSSHNTAEQKPVVSNKQLAEKSRRGGRNKGNFVQTQGVFSDGLAPGKPREYSARSSGNSAQPTLEKPKLNLNKTISKKNEDGCMKNLLKDDFIDDPAILPDFHDPPKSLPLLLNAKSNCYQDLDSTFEYLQVKTEKLENVKAEDMISTTSDLMQIFEDTVEPRLLIFDFPEEFVQPEDKKSSKHDKNEKKVESDQGVKMPQVTHRLSNVGNGFWGTLRILDDGSAYISVGQEQIPVVIARHCPKQSVMSVHLDTTTSRGEIINLGKASATLKCSSDLTFTFGNK